MNKKQYYIGFTITVLLSALFFAAAYYNYTTYRDSHQIEWDCFPPKTYHGHDPYPLDAMWSPGLETI